MEKNGRLDSPFTPTFLPFNIWWSYNHGLSPSGGGEGVCQAQLTKVTVSSTPLAEDAGLGRSITTPKASHPISGLCLLDD